MKRAIVFVAGTLTVATLGSCASSGPVSRASNASTTAATPTLAASTTSAPAVTVIVTVQVTQQTTTGPASTAGPASTVAKTVTTTVAKKPPATKAPTTTQPPTTTTAPNYKPVSPPIAPKDHTADVPTSGDLPNGVYWAVYSGGEKLTPTVELRQAYFGDACIAKAAEIGDECVDDILLLPTPVRDIDLTLASNVKLTVSDAQTQKSYQITPDELVKIRASSPSAGAPPDFSFTPFAFLATVTDGKVTKFEQLWTP
jgi:hypothetical protein